jgi:putative DNA primase/helicase
MKLININLFLKSMSLVEQQLFAKRVGTTYPHQSYGRHPIPAVNDAHLSPIQQPNQGAAMADLIPNSSLSVLEKTQIEHALKYLQCGWKLVMIPHGSKAPKTAGWNQAEQLVSTVESAIAKLSHGALNMGLVHTPSLTCAIDVDDEAFTRVIFDGIGLDLDAILAAGPRILSKAGRAKVIFSLPESLEMQKITWPKPGGTGPLERITVFELRTGLNQDVLPPSLHPDGHNYAWAEQQAPWDYPEVPRLPAVLEEFWRAYAADTHNLRADIQALCPWQPTPAPNPAESNPGGPRRVEGGDHQNIIGQFNQQVSCAELLISSNYKKMGKRYLAPNSSTKLPGVVVLTDGGQEKAYSHHASDILADGKAHDAFDLLAILFHNNDTKATLTAAAQWLGIERYPQRHQPDVVIDLAAMRANQLARQGKAALEEGATLGRRRTGPAPARGGL